jgi:hypothetical protein
MEPRHRTRESKDHKRMSQVEELLSILHRLPYRDGDIRPISGILNCPELSRLFLFLVSHPAFSYVSNGHQPFLLTNVYEVLVEEI